MEIMPFTFADGESKLTLKHRPLSFLISSWGLGWKLEATFRDRRGLTKPRSTRGQEASGERGEGRGEEAFGKNRYHVSSNTMIM